VFSAETPGRVIFRFDLRDPGQTVAAARSQLRQFSLSIAKSLTVNVGDTVNLHKRSAGSTRHRRRCRRTVLWSGTVTSCSVTFNAAGTFPYECVFHAIPSA